VETEKERRVEMSRGGVSAERTGSATWYSAFRGSSLKNANL